MIWSLLWLEWDGIYDPECFTFACNVTNFSDIKCMELTYKIAFWQIFRDNLCFTIFIFYNEITGNELTKNKQQSPSEFGNILRGKRFFSRTILFSRNPLFFIKRVRVGYCFRVSTRIKKRAVLINKNDLPIRGIYK